jgi:hypothetical protein
LIVGHGRHPHFNAPEFPLTGLDMGDTFFRVTDHRLVSTKMTAFATERFSKSQVTVFAKHILLGVSGYFLSLPIEEKYPAVGVVSDDTFFEIIQNPLESMGV